MSESITISIRLSPKLHHALKLKAKKEKRGKNWIISQALENYLELEGRPDLETEAQRQSLIAAQQNEHFQMDDSRT